MHVTHEHYLVYYPRLFLIYIYRVTQSLRQGIELKMDSHLLIEVYLLSEFESNR